MKKIIPLLISLLCLLSTAYFSYKVIKWKLDSIANKKITKKIETRVI